LKNKKVWRRILGYQAGEKLLLKVTYLVPPIKKGEIGRIEDCWYANDFLGYCFTLKFSKGRGLIVFSDEVEEI